MRQGLSRLCFIVLVSTLCFGVATARAEGDDARADALYEQFRKAKGQPKE